MKKLLLASLLAAASSAVFASGEAITVYKDPNCGCCEGWVAYLRDAGYHVKAVNTPDMTSVKARLGVPAQLASCHTAVLDGTGQIIEGHVPDAAIRKLIGQPKVHGVSAPGMPLNAPGMGKMDGKLVTVDFSGKPFSTD